MKFQKRIFAGIVCGAITLQALPAQSFMLPTFSAKECAVSGSQLLNQDRYEEALVQFRRAYFLLDGSQQNKRVQGLLLSDMGECSRRLHRLSEAKKYFSQAVPNLRLSSQGPMNRDVSKVLSRWALAYLAEKDFTNAEALLKQCVENALGVWTYNYSDLGSVPVYIAALAQVSDAKDGTGAKWYEFGARELSKIVSIGGDTGELASGVLARLQDAEARAYGEPSNGNFRTQFQNPPRGNRRDPYLQNPGSTPTWRASYGLNGTRPFFTRGY